MAKGYHFEHRSWVVLWLLLFAFAALLFRVMNLSVFKRSFLQHQGDLRSLRVESVPAPRARILDRSGIPIAVSIPMESIWVDPCAWQGSDQIIKKLAKILGVHAQRLTKKIHHPHRRFIYIKRHAKPSVAKRVKALNLSGIHFKKEYRRFYPKGKAMAHLLGITNVDDQGQEGIELAYDETLRGQPQKRLVEKDRLGRVIAIKKTMTLGKKGKDVQLSIDSQLQEIAYESLVKGAQKAGAHSGSVVIMNPETGEILAMTNIPSYNPNHSKKQISHMRNQAITDVFEPGSTLKTFGMAFVLSRGKKPDDLVHIGNGKWLYQCKWIKDVHAKKKWLSLTEIIQYSSNVGISKLLVEVPANAFLNFLQTLGFGGLSFVGLPGEVAGSFESSIHDHSFGLAALSFGYGISVTNLQLTHAYAMVANHGRDVGVHILKVMQKEHGKQIISPNISQQLLLMLQKVTGPKGTASRAQVKGLTVAGKTGTAHRAHHGQYSNKHYLSSFVGMVPADKPKWVISVVLNDPKRSMRFGGQSAAPIFAEIVKKGWWLVDVADG